LPTLREECAVNRLRLFQKAFASALLAQEARCAAAAPVAGLVSQPGFAVYRNTVMKGCIDALQANFPAVTRLVGEEWFRAAAAIYVRGHPPRHPALLDYGHDFPAFLAAFEPARELPYLPGVARLDRFWSEAHGARDETPLAASAVAALDATRLARAVLRPQASARWAWFEQPIYTLWRQNRPAAGEDVSFSGEVEWHAEGALVLRPEDEVRSLGLDQAGCVFLDACAAGEPLAQAAMASLAIDPGTDLTALLARLLGTGAFGRLTMLVERDIP
jgi:hypothetical protein